MRLSARRAATAALGLLMLLSGAGCGHMIGSRIAQAPNQGLSEKEVGRLTPAQIREWGASRELRVQVGPPAATLSMWVFEPSKKKIRVSTTRFVREEMHWEFSQADRPKSSGAEPLGTILVLHGIYDSNEGYNGIWGRIFAAAGYRVVLVDLRGQGRSTGDWLTFGVLESRDISQVIDALEKRNLIAGKLGLFGVSYGGAVAIQAAGLDPRIEAVATVAAFSSFEEVVYPFGRSFVSRRLGDLGWQALKGLVPQVVQEVGRAGRFNPAEASPRQAIANTCAPVLLIHGTDDQYVPCTEAEELFAQAPQHSKLALIDGETHLSLALRRVDRLRALSLDWFDQWLALPARSIEPAEEHPPAVAHKDDKPTM